MPYPPPPPPVLAHDRNSGEIQFLSLGFRRMICISEHGHYSPEISGVESYNAGCQVSCLDPLCPYFPCRCGEAIRSVTGREGGKGVGPCRWRFCIHSWVLPSFAYIHVQLPAIYFYYHNNQGYGGRASLDVSVSGLVDSVRDEESNVNIDRGMLINPARVGDNKTRF